MPNFGLSYTARIPIWNSAGTDLVPGIATASMTPVLYRDDVSANASGSMFSAGGGWYGLTLDDAENSADNVRIHVIVSATAADGFAQWDNSHDVIDAGSASAGTANTITLRIGTKFPQEDGYNKNIIELLEGSGAGDTRLITDYVSATRVATVADNWSNSVLPGTTTRYQIRRNVLTNQAFPSNFENMLIPADGRPEVNLIEIASVSASIDDITGTAQHLFNEVWNNTGISFGDTAAPPNWGGSNVPINVLKWVAARLSLRHHQASTVTHLYNSANTVIASASVSYTSTSASIGIWKA